MTASDCEQLHAYVDGELGPDDREAFEAHLATCDDCGAELPKLLALMSVLENAMAAAPPKLSVVSGGDGPATVRPVQTKPVPNRRRLWWASGGAAAAVAAAIVIIVFWPTPPVIALGPTRTNEWRTSYPGTDGYRPRDVARGASSSEPISLETLASLERAKDYEGVAVASLLAGDRERAVRAFAQAPNTPNVDADRAALELADGSAEAIERALDDVDRALAAEPNNPRALWNRALVLSKLELGFAAALDFERVAALKEPGWADEAASRAKVLREAVERRQERWEKANAAGEALVQDGAPVPPELLASGSVTLLQRLFYDAVRASPSPDRVEALLPLARAIDNANGTTRLTSYVQRIATSDFHIRRPLADTYRELMRRGSLPNDEADAFLRQLEAKGLDDIWLGAANWLGKIGTHLDDYRHRADATQDPWFVEIAEQEAAKAEISRGENTAAEHRLHKAIAAARQERLSYRVISLEEVLASLHDGALHLSQVVTDRREQYRDAIAAGEWRIETNTLTQLAGINQDRYAQNLARAYLVEFIERLKRWENTKHADQQLDCTRREYAYQSLAAVSMLLGENSRAREEIAAIPNCGPPQKNDNRDTQRTSRLRTAYLWATLYRTDHREEDARLARDNIAMVRDEPELSVEHQVRIAYVDGALLGEVDRGAAQRSFRKMLVLLGHADDAVSIKLRSDAFSELALDAAHAGKFQVVLSVLAEELAIKAPERCALAIAMRRTQIAIAYSDAHGQIGGQVLNSQTPIAPNVERLVPASISASLHACERVAVMSRAPILGIGTLLPIDIAWSYVLRTSSSPQRDISISPHRVIIDNPDPPADLKLPPLSPYADTDDRETQLLRGTEATPSRVLQAIRTASVIEFHTHGIIANDLSEASYLVLSPDLDRRYALTPSDVTQVKLEASPLVILGACHAASSSRSPEGGLGLAEAFLNAGARAVIASPDSVPDLEARAFFTAVRERVLHGTDPAIAVRDERIQRLAASRGDAWVARVVVFE